MWHISSTKSIVVLFLVALLVTFGRPAKADSSCTALLANKASQAKGTQRYAIELTMHREGVKLVSYAAGELTPNSDGSFSGSAYQQLFSDRMDGNQPFSIQKADTLDVITLSPSGFLDIHYKPWNFKTSWDLSCVGSMLTKYIPGYGIVTLTFRDLFTPIQ